MGIPEEIWEVRWEMRAVARAEPMPGMERSSSRVAVLGLRRRVMGERSGGASSGCWGRVTMRQVPRAIAVRARKARARW